MTSDFDFDNDFDNDMGMPDAENDELEGESSNRTFIIAASVLGGIILLSLLCMAVYALVLAPRQQQQTMDAESTRVAQNTQVADMLTATFVADAMAMTIEPTATIVVSPTASPTPVIALPTDTPTPTPNIAGTEAVATALTKIAAVNQETPMATLPSELSKTGFADDVGVPALFGMMLLLIAVIFFARKLRQANA